MPTVDPSLVRAHQQELLRVACLRRAGRCLGLIRGRRS
jgi:hypothetical protein